MAMYRVQADPIGKPRHRYSEFWVVFLDSGFHWHDDILRLCRCFTAQENQPGFSMSDARIYFAYPGDLATQTGGYHYDRRLIAGLEQLGVEVECLSLPNHANDTTARFQDSARACFANIPDQSLVIVDGLAFGLLDETAVAEAERLKLVALCHHPLSLESGIDAAKKQSLLASERRALSCALATIVTSEFTAQTLIDTFDLPAEKIVVALPGTDRGEFARCQGDPPTLLTVATLTYRKGHDILIAALADLKDHSWQAEFIGGLEFDSQWVGQLREQVNSLGLAERIRFHGQVEDVRAAYLRADIFVMPSRFEGYGMVFAEALAAGLPVVATRAGAIPNVVPASAGMLVPADDVAALSKVLRQVISSTSLRAELQQGAREAAKALPTWQDCAGRVYEKLKELLSP
jgi:glycosyltransferase involved in cell wall biosynthesis